MDFILSSITVLWIWIARIWRSIFFLSASFLASRADLASCLLLSAMSCDTAMAAWAAPATSPRERAWATLSCPCLSLSIWASLSYILSRASIWLSYTSEFLSESSWSFSICSFKGSSSLCLSSIALELASFWSWRIFNSFSRGSMVFISAIWRCKSFISILFWRILSARAFGFEARTSRLYSLILLPSLLISLAERLETSPRLAICSASSCVYPKAVSLFIFLISLSMSSREMPASLLIWSILSSFAAGPPFLIAWLMDTTSSCSSLLRAPLFFLLAFK